MKHLLTLLLFISTSVMAGSHELSFLCKLHKLSNNGNKEYKVTESFFYNTLLRQIQFMGRTLSCIEDEKKIEFSHNIIS